MQLMLHPLLISYFKWHTVLFIMKIKYDSYHDIKLDALEGLIETANGKPVLIAYWYKSYLRRIKDKFYV